MKTVKRTHLTYAFTLLMGVGLGLFTNSMFNMAGHNVATQQAAIAQGGPKALFGLYNFGGMAVGFLGAILSFLLLIGTVYGYLRARLRLPAAEPVTPAAVWVELKSRLGRMILVLVLFVAAYSIIVFGFLALLIPAANANGFGFLLFFPLMGLLAYVGIVFSLYFPLLWLEDLSIFATVGRCFQLIKGRWWATFGLLLVVSIIQGMLAFVFVLPQYGVLIGKVLHVEALSSDVFGVLAQCIYAVGIIFTYAVPLLAVAFQYFHLIEQKEGWGLRLLVEELGQPQVIPVAQSSHYRPDEEGDY
ncbi:MAG: hypothetical protein EOO56_25115 [Hymenobacter sp.]|nr:MAG: hypothetical protein EOO56_25115 [Hymenobacter sp.]